MAMAWYDDGEIRFIKYMKTGKEMSKSNGCDSHFVGVSEEKVFFMYPKL